MTSRRILFLLLAAIVFLPAAYSQVFTFSMIDANGNATVLQTGSTIQFPPTPIGQTATVTIAMLNQGTDPDFVNTIFVDGPGFQLGGVPFPGTQIMPGSVVTFTVKFTPTLFGEIQAPLKINFSDENNVFILDGSALASSFTYQIQQSSTQITPGQTISFPDTQVGQTSPFTISVTNGGNANGTIGAIAVQGSGFTLTGLPFLPTTLPPGGTITFNVVFSPTASGAASGGLQIGTDTFVLAGNSIGGSLSYSYVTGGKTVTLPIPGTVVLSPAAIGGSSSVPFLISNQGTAEASVTSIGVGSTTTGGANTGFSLTNVPGLPLTLNPGDSVSFNIVFSPSGSGVTTASLVIDTVTFTLSGSGTAPVALPTYAFSGGAAVQSPMAQPAISLGLSSPYSLPLSGTLTLTFLSDVFVDDPSIQFSTGSRVVNFTIPANTTSAVFNNGAKQIRLATGSVAGTITVTPSFQTTTGINLTPASPLALQMTVPKLAPSVLSASVDTKTSTGFNFTFTGMATGRDLTQIAFHFVVAPSANLTIPDLTSNVEQSFNNWYQSAASQTFGSLFTVTVPFNMSGQVAGFASVVDAIQSVGVTLTNHEGVSSAQTVTLQ